MKKNYCSNYLKTISFGMKESITTIDKNEVSFELFFSELVSRIRNVQDNDGKLIFLGNGASSAFSNHMALDWLKNGKVISRSLSDSALLTALSNDFNYETALIEYLKIEKICSNDLVITTSSSGNSKNIINVLEYCKKLNIHTFALSGLKSPNESINKAKFSLYVPMKTYGMVECIHQIFHHLLLDMFMNITEWERNDYQNMDINNYNI